MLNVNLSACCAHHYVIHMEMNEASLREGETLHNYLKELQGEDLYCFGVP